VLIIFGVTCVKGYAEEETAHTILQEACLRVSFIADCILRYNTASILKAGMV
jgi:hypothetical protein